MLSDLKSGIWASLISKTGANSLINPSSFDSKKIIFGIISKLFHMNALFVPYWTLTMVFKENIIMRLQSLLNANPDNGIPQMVQSNFSLLFLAGGMSSITSATLVQPVEEILF